jgi:hypothetical protein
MGALPVAGFEQPTSGQRRAEVKRFIASEVKLVLVAQRASAIDQ